MTPTRTIPHKQSKEPDVTKTSEMAADPSPAPPAPGFPAPRLLAHMPPPGAERGAGQSLAEHRTPYAEPPHPRSRPWTALIDAVDRAGRRGRGGARVREGVREGRGGAAEGGAAPALRAGGGAPSHARGQRRDARPRRPDRPAGGLLVPGGGDGGGAGDDARERQRGRRPPRGARGPDRGPPRVDRLAGGSPRGRVGGPRRGLLRDVGGGRGLLAGLQPGGALPGGGL